ncbi:HNH endonuclease signature motif containing protein [Streptomyces sp. NPDC054956]
MREQLSNPKADEFFQDRIVRGRVLHIQRGSRPEAEDDAALTDTKLRIANRHSERRDLTGFPELVFLITAEPGDLGTHWLTSPMLRAAGWSKTALNALIPENAYRFGGDSPSDSEVLYNRAQIDAVLRSPVGTRIAAISFWTDRAVRDQVRVLQQGSRPGAKQGAESVACYISSHRKVPQPTSAPGALPARELNPTPVPLPPQRLAPVNFAYPVSTEPARRTVVPSAAPAAPFAPPSQAQRATEYRRLVRLTEDRQAATRGQRRPANARPVRLSSARDAVILRSGGRCENPRCGGQPEDFTDAGAPLLDVDHIDEIAAGGADDPVQMIALCPNCHRIKTYGRSRHELIPILRDIARQRHASLFAPE